ncbi:MAG: hypothetical protein JXQ67_05985 [Campylobacterales bacterium]|nr:hypothetical protein [Campylobacterales bacterium]
MENFKLKLVLSLLAGVVFSFIFIIIAFAVPVKDNQNIVIVKPKGKLEQVSQSAKER